MNLLEIILTVLIAAAVILALAVIVRKKKNNRGCSCGCEDCQLSCQYKNKQ